MIQTQTRPSFHTVQIQHIIGITMPCIMLSIVPLDGNMKKKVSQLAKRSSVILVDESDTGKNKLYQGTSSF